MNDASGQGVSQGWTTEQVTTQLPKRKPGRPKGSKSKPKGTVPVASAPPGGIAWYEYVGENKPMFTYECLCAVENCLGLSRGLIRKSFRNAAKYL